MSVQLTFGPPKPKEPGAQAPPAARSYDKSEVKLILGLLCDKTPFHDGLGIQPIDYFVNEHYNTASVPHVRTNHGILAKIGGDIVYALNKNYSDELTALFKNKMHIETYQAHNYVQAIMKSMWDSEKPDTRRNTIFSDLSAVGDVRKTAVLSEHAQKMKKLFYFLRKSVGSPANMQLTGPISLSADEQLELIRSIARHVSLEEYLVSEGLYGDDVSDLPQITEAFQIFRKVLKGTLKAYAEETALPAPYTAVISALKRHAPMFANHKAGPDSSEQWLIDNLRGGKIGGANSGQPYNRAHVKDIIRGILENASIDDIAKRTLRTPKGISSKMQGDFLALIANNNKSALFLKIVEKMISVGIKDLTYIDELIPAALSALWTPQGGFSDSRISVFDPDLIQEVRDGGSGSGGSSGSGGAGGAGGATREHKEHSDSESDDNDEAMLNGK